MKKRLIALACAVMMAFSMVPAASPENAVIVEAAKFNAKKAKKNIKVTYQQTSEGVLAIYKNKNSYPVKLVGKVAFKDAEGKDIDKITGTNECLGAKKTMAYFYEAPKDSRGMYISYANYTKTFSVAKTSYKDRTDSIHLKTDVGATTCAVSANNLSGKELTSIHCTFVFKDSANKIVCCRNVFMNCTIPSQQYDTEISYAQYSVSPAKVKVYKNWAY